MKTLYFVAVFSKRAAIILGNNFSNPLYQRDFQKLLLMQKFKFVKWL